jgi:predicted hydrocarbon binding protein
MRLDSSAIVTGYSLDRARYLWERKEGGKNILNNFEIVRNLGFFAFSTPKKVRAELDDFGHINLLNLRKFSFLYLGPNQTYELYSIGKLIGYYMTNAGFMQISGLLDLIDTLVKEGVFWKILGNKFLQDNNQRGWRNTQCAFLKFNGVDKLNKVVFYQLRENPSAMVHASHPPCFMEIGALCGQAEGLSGGIWDGKETKCQAKGDECNELEIYLHDKEEKPDIELLTKDELNSILNELIENTVNKKSLRSKELTDHFYIIVDQVMNYYLLSLSPGHAVLSKYSGRVCGERIAEKAQLQGQDAALAYLEDMFLYLKAGILHSEKAGDRVIIRMKESVYASGVNNIHMNLCIFLAGIIEGALNKATGQKWDVSEMKCLASGFPECEFWCKKI